ncbi:MAG TPA: HlyD family efflux transporter periplasmic adaptor subunit [Frateuria sp.]|uniref:HlyD family secretion protein n=1 Tax=Frateuria sp. TaxID=2211372 RepID=UPI002D7E3EBA|nr:HlyD family efflux transporter periplasmic adaptor subunit [Frateuria sp.]HET6803953.1 HlyD family efflux transporter periplasmic adaptor subunit [Frateuria sp.]
MTGWNHRRLCALALPACLLLAACTQHDDPSPAAPTPAYAAVARGRIDVEGGLLNLGMPREGRLAEVDVHEGQSVRRGQVLAALDAQPARLAVATAQAEQDQARAQVSLIGARLAAARLRARRLAAAARAGAGDGQSADDARAAADELAAQQQAAHAAVSVAGQKLASARFELEQHTLRAPLDADVIHVAAQPGMLATAQSGPLFVLLPHVPRLVRADLSEAYMDAVKPGMAAQVTADGDPQGGPWRAHVLRVGQLVGPSALEDDPQQRINSRTVECVLAFDVPTPLRVGQRVMVRFGAPAPAAAKAR